MKLIKLFAALVLLLTVMWACQKELSFDGVSIGVFRKDAGGGCPPIATNGIYTKDSVIAASTNYIDVEVNVTVAGTFDIKSDTVNGISFSKAGSVGVGINTIRLYASGKPIAAGSTIFTVKYGSSTCSVTITVVGPGTGAAIYTLGGAPATCTGAILAGTYTQGVALGAGNTATLQVNVTQPGTYNIAAASVNGMLFTATGVFTTTGAQTVTLNGAGVPLAAGSFNVTATTGTSSCIFSVVVAPAGGGGGAASYTLNSATGVCSGAAQNGTYTAGTVLAPTNTVTLQVTVTTVGTYTITSNSNNGMSFSASGTFTTTGSQPVTLIGTGTPTNSGGFNFTATAGASTCIFTVLVNPAAPPANTDYIPETFGTNYSEKLVGGLPSDTFYVKVNPNTIVKNGITYKIFEGLDTGTPTDSTYRRKNGGLYYQLFDQSYGFDNNFNTDGLVLDSNLSINATWTINLGSNFVSGAPASGSIKATILDKGATATIAGNSYTNVIKVEYIYKYNLGSGDVDYYRWEIWYAKGKGIIHEILNDIPVTQTDTYDVTRIQVL